MRIRRQKSDEDDYQRSHQRTNDGNELHSPGSESQCQRIRKAQRRQHHAVYHQRYAGQYKLRANEMSQHHVKIGHDQAQKAPLVALAKDVQQGCGEPPCVAQEKNSEDGDQDNPDHILQHFGDCCTCLLTPSENLCLMGRNKLLDFELSVIAPAVPIAKLPNNLSACNLL